MGETGADKTKKIIYLVTVLAVVVIGLSILFAVKPEIEKVYVTKDEFEEQKLRFELVRQDAVNARSYEELLVNIKNNQELLDNALVKKGGEVEFIKKIEEIANEVGNEVEIEHKKIEIKKAKVASVTDQSAETVEAQKQDASKEKDRIGLTITAKGNYKNFLEFLYKLENMPNVFEIESVSVVKGRSMGKFITGEDKATDYTEGSITISFIPVEL